MTDRSSINNPHNGPDDVVADAVTRHWVDTVLSASLRPYARLARLERPIGWWLLLLPGWWAIALATLSSDAPWPDIHALALFLIGSIVMRGAGCTFNDIIDRNYDGQVERTNLRPIPSGQVSVKQAIIFMVLLALIGFVVLLQFNSFAIILGVLSLLTVAIYPFMKRFTYWPQAFLGLAFNWGALLGFAAIQGKLGLASVLLYCGGISWTLAYDTIYAHQDKEDDLLVGIKSTALKFGANTVYWLSGFFVGAVILIGSAAWLAGAGIIFYTALAAAALHAAWQIARLDIDDSQQCLKLFRSNRDFGLLIFAGVIIEHLSQSLMAV